MLWESLNWNEKGKGRKILGDGRGKVKFKKEGKEENLIKKKDTAELSRKRRKWLSLRNN